MIQILKMLAGWKGYASAAVIAGIVCWSAAWTAQGWRYDARIASLQRDYAESIAESAHRAERAQAQARATEQARQAEIEEIRNETDR